jgi:glutathione S-transferase
MRSPTVTKIEAKRIARCFAVLEAALQGRDHLLASGFSAADVAVGQAVAMSRHFVTLDGYPALAAWWARISARPAYARAAPQPGQARLYARDFYAPLPERAP